MRRLGATLAALLTVAMLLGGTALGGIEWCAEDPSFTVLGSTFALTTAIEAPAADVSGITYVIDVPSNAGRVHISYPGGRRIPTTVIVTYGQQAYDGGASFRVAATVTAVGPAGSSVLLQLNGETVAKGTTGDALTYRFAVTAD